VTAEQRALIRAEIDRRQRATVTAPEKACGGCGGEIEEVTLGCRLCRRREQKRVKQSAEIRVRAALGPLVGIDEDEHVNRVITAIRFPRNPPGRKPGSGPLPRNVRPSC
jgi:hypothetical protein